jgi:serine carboxypeptidase-like clade 2
MGNAYTPWIPKMKKETVGEEDPCPYISPLVEYFNKESVRSALHIPDYVGMWDMCNMTYNYTASEKGSRWIWEELHEAPENYRFLKYSGDTDGAVPTLGTVKWINDLAWPITQKYRPYYLTKNEIAGYIEEREGLTFATVHGSGHMVPQFKRPEAFYLIKNWLQGNKI